MTISAAQLHEIRRLIDLARRGIDVVMLEPDEAEELLDERTALRSCLQNAGQTEIGPEQVWSDALALGEDEGGP